MAGAAGDGGALDWDAIVEQTHSPPSTSQETQQRPWEVDERDVTEFGGFSLDDDVDVVMCEACKKPVLREAHAFHLQNCAMVQGMAEGRLSPSVLRAATQDAGPSSDAATLQSRRKNLGGGKKNRGPIDLDRQCGVINNKGLPCSRSLTCKSHSMGAKRHVAGRSRPYDVLLFEWQKATNPAFVARLEEKERSIAAAKLSAGAKDKKRKTMADRRGAGADLADRDGSARLVMENPMDMYASHASFQDVDTEMRQVLETIHMSAARERTTILPLATRSLAGQYTTRMKRFRVLRQYLARGLSGTAHMQARLSETAKAQGGDAPVVAAGK
ncbi:SAGA complex subunit Sgf73 [Malassezia caprae]|uniref:SAGA complex subunit Sgf73 n=1 Tax=Malassezia caprae TaxID=1381934 RepID=A0AAF0E8P8_9BASI|nr:SAGA complex subunit Sgf73 [Malassezia caprae]